MKRAVNVTLDEELVGRLRVMAQARGLPLSRVLNEAAQVGVERLSAAVGDQVKTVLRVAAGSTIYVIGSHEVKQEGKG